MSTEHDNGNTIPDYVPTGGGRAWRISQGTIRRGQEGDAEERKALLGRLVSITERYGNTDDGRLYGKLAVTLECRDGRQTVTTPLVQPTTGKPTLSSCVSLAEALLDCAKGELVQIEAAQGKTKNKFGSYSTYARVSHIDPVTFKPSPTAKRERDGGFDEAYLDALMEDLRRHPAWMDQEEADSASGQNAVVPASGGPYAALLALLKGRRWPGPDVAWPVWAKQVEKGTGKLFESPGEVPDAVWRAALDQMTDATEQPAWLAEYDPFEEPEAKPKPGAFA